MSAENSVARHRSKGVSELLIGFLTVAAFLAIRYVAVRSGRDARTSIALAAGGALAVAVAGAATSAMSTRHDAPETTAAVAPAAAVPLRGTVVHSRKLHLGPRDLARLVPSGARAVAAYIDRLNGINADAEPARLRFARGPAVTVSGWAGEPSRGPADALIVVIDGKQRIDITPFYDRPRTDVAQHFNDRAMEFSGFERAPVPTAGLAKGRHRISVGLVGRDRTHYVPAPQVRSFELL